MKPLIPTASKLHIARKCLHPWAPSTEWHDDGGSSFYARRGTFMHAHIASALDQDAPRAPDVDPDDAAAVEGRALADVALAWWKDAASERDDWTDEPWCELTFAVGSKGTVSKLGRVRREDYPRDAFVGTADAIWFDDAGDMHVLDWKSGRPEHTEGVDDNAQLQALAAMVAEWNVGAAIAGRAHVHLAFVSSEGVDLRTWTLTADELDAVLTELVELVSDLKRGKADTAPRTGSHCRYCPVRRCAARDGLADDLAAPETTADLVTHRLSESIESQEHAAWLVEHVAIAEGVVERVKAKLREYADANGGIQLADGKVWGRREVAVERVADDPQVAKILGAYMLDDALKVSTSKAAITKAAKAMGVDADEVLGQLQSSGLIKSAVTVRYEARKVK